MRFIGEQSSDLILGQDFFLGPTPFQFPSDDRFVELAAPASSFAVGRQFHELLCDGRSTGNDMTRSQVARTGPSRGAPVDPAMFIETAILQRDGHSRKPRAHLLERAWKLCSGFRGCELSDLAAAKIEQR